MLCFSLSLLLLLLPISLNICCRQRRYQFLKLFCIRTRSFPVSCFYCDCLRPYSLFYDNTSPCPVRIRVEILVQSPSESQSQSQSESPCHRPVQRLTSLLLGSLPSLPSLSLPATPTMPSIPSTHPAAAFPSTFYERVKVDLLLLLLFVLATWNMLRVGLFNLQHLQLEHTEKEG